MTDIAILGPVDLMSGIFANALRWAEVHPLWAAVILVGLAVGGALVAVAFAGAAGPLAGGLLANLVYGGVGAVLGTVVAFGVLCVVGNLGGGPGGNGSGPVGLKARFIETILISREKEADGLRVEITYGGDSKPPTETWRRTDLSSKVEKIADDIKNAGRGDNTVTVEFKDVPARLQETVTEEFWLHGVILRVGEDERP